MKSIVRLQRNGAIRNIEPGDLTKQMEVRKRLNCKSFDWFMKEVAFDQDKYYPAVEPPDGAKGQIENKAHAGFCVSAKSTGKDEQVRRGVTEKDRASFVSKTKKPFDVVVNAEVKSVLLIVCEMGLELEIVEKEDRRSRRKVYVAVNNLQVRRWQHTEHALLVLERHSAERY